MLLKNIKTNQFRENKKIVEKVKIFGKKKFFFKEKDNLTSQQKTSIAMEMLTEKFSIG